METNEFEQIEKDVIKFNGEIYSKDKAGERAFEMMKSSAQSKKKMLSIIQNNINSLKEKRLSGETAKRNGFELTAYVDELVEQQLQYVMISLEAEGFKLK